MRCPETVVGEEVEETSECSTPSSIQEEDGSEAKETGRRWRITPDKLEA